MNFESAFLGPQSIQVCHLRLPELTAYVDRHVDPRRPLPPLSPSPLSLLPPSSLSPPTRVGPSLLRRPPARCAPFAGADGVAGCAPVLPWRRRLASPPQASSPALAPAPAGRSGRGRGRAARSGGAQRRSKQSARSCGGLADSRRDRGLSVLVTGAAGFVGAATTVRWCGGLATSWRVEASPPSRQWRPRRWSTRGTEEAAPPRSSPGGPMKARKGGGGGRRRAGEGREGSSRVDFERPLPSLPHLRRRASDGDAGVPLLRQRWRAGPGGPLLPRSPLSWRRPDPSSWRRHSPQRRILPSRARRRPASRGSAALLPPLSGWSSLPRRRPARPAHGGGRRAWSSPGRRMAVRGGAARGWPRHEHARGAGPPSSAPSLSPVAAAAACAQAEARCRGRTGRERKRESA